MVTYNPDIDMLKQPPVLESLTRQNIPFKNHFLFNNNDIYEKPMTDISLLSTTIQKKHWDIGTESFLKF